MRNELNLILGGFVLDNIKPNFSELGRRYNVDRRTVKNHFDQLKSGSTRINRKPRVINRLLDGFTSIIESKVSAGNSAKAIYYFLKDKGYTGSYSTVRDYARLFKTDQIRKATIRFETNPGISSQVDWKEDITLHDRLGNRYTFSIFLMVLGYSRYKFIKLVPDRKQSTLFESMIEVFNEFGGMTQEIWFDNMKQVVDHRNYDAHSVVLNEKFKQFSKDAGFKPLIARPFRPQTKGKVESLARLMERLRVYDYEFDNQLQLTNIVNTFKDQINNEVSQGNNKVPSVMLDKEKKYLRKVDTSNLQTYLNKKLWRVVSNESMIMYQGNKYSVPLQYIGTKVNLKVDSKSVYIFNSDNDLIRRHDVSINMFNYNSKDAFDVLKSDVFKNRNDSDIYNYMKENLRLYDLLGENNEPDSSVN